MPVHFNIDAEKPFLAAVIRRPEILADCPQIGIMDFSPVNRVVFSALQACVASGTPFSKFLLIDRLNSLNIKIADTIEPAAYVNALELLAVSDAGAIGLAKEIKRTTIRREVRSIGEKIQAVADDDRDKKGAVQLVGEATKVFNDHVNLIEGTREREPSDLYGTIRSFLDIDNSFSSKAIVPPFKVFSDLYGFWDAGAVHVIVSRMKIGKSTFWLSAIQQLAEADKDDSFRALVLDTELTTKENQSRTLSAISGVREFYIRQGWYKRRKEDREKVEAAADFVEPMARRLSHIYVGGLDMPAILSIARRWAHRTLVDGKRGFIVLDYLKLNAQGEFGSKSPLFIEIGSKIDAMKNLSKELDIPCLCFAQSNRENVETKAGVAMQNSSVVGGSDMIAQFASNIYLLEELAPDERAQLMQLGPKSATHSLREIACRQRGPCELGEDKLVRYKDERGKDRYCRNYLLYRFDSFSVTEVGTFRSASERARLAVDVQGEVKPGGGLL